MSSAALTANDTGVAMLDTEVDSPLSLLDSLKQGFLLIFLLKNGDAPSSAEHFRQRIGEFLRQYDIDNKEREGGAEQAYLAKYAFCATLDEVILSSSFAIRTDWELQPLQIQYFGDHLAGDRFFDHLDQVRLKGQAWLAVLEVFHYCLLLGFQGKYRLEGTEKLNFLTGRVGEEIRQLRGKKRDFSPHWAIPDLIMKVARRELPLWGFALVLLSLLLIFLLVLFFLLQSDLGDLSRALDKLIQPVAEQAYLIIRTS